MLRKVAIIQARTGSTRLPKKVLKKLGDKTLLEILIKRLKKSHLLDDIIVATSIGKEDDVIEEIANKAGVKCYRGDVNDVLRRYYEAAREYNANIIVRVTADNPLTDAKIIDKLIEKHIQNKADYTICRNLPLGIGAEVISWDALKIAEENARLLEEREHVTLYIKSHPEIFKIFEYNSNLNNENLRLTVDTKEDFEVIRKIYENMGELEDLRIEDVINFLNTHPEISNINAHIKQKVPEAENKIKVSVIVRTHNSEKFVRKAIESLMNQTLSKELYEIIVIDDDSTDGTISALKDYAKWIRLFKERKLGAVRALNFGIKRAMGEYFIVLDSDDYFEPTILEEMLKIMEKEKPAFVYCDYYEKNVENGSIKIISLKDNIFNSVAVGIMFRKKIVEEIGGYDEELIFPEYDLLIKILKKYKGKYIPKPLFTYVRHRKSMTANKETVEKGFKQLFNKYGKIKGLRRY